MAIVYHLNMQTGNTIFKCVHPLPKPKSYGILVVDILEEMETIARAIRPITYKKTFRSLKVIFV